MKRYMGFNNVDKLQNTTIIFKEQTSFKPWNRTRLLHFVLLHFPSFPAHSTYVVCLMYCLFAFELNSFKLKGRLPRPDRPTNLKSLNLATWFFIIADPFRSSAQKFSSFPARIVTTVPSSTSPSAITCAAQRHTQLSFLFSSSDSYKLSITIYDYKMCWAYSFHVFIDICTYYLLRILKQFIVLFGQSHQTFVCRSPFHKNSFCQPYLCLYKKQHNYLLLTRADIPLHHQSRPESLIGLQCEINIISIKYLALKLRRLEINGIVKNKCD